jgi:hypothetical protein
MGMYRMQSMVALGLGGALALAAVGDRSAGAASPKKTASFRVTAVHSEPGAQVTVNSQVWVTPTQARADVTHPLQGQITFLISNGAFYQLDPKSKRGVKGPLPPEFKKNGDNFSMLVSSFAFDANSALKRAKKVRTEPAAGYTCDVYTNTMSEGDVRRTITIWLPQRMEPKFPVKAILENKVSKSTPGATVNQTQSVSITLSSIRLNAPVAPSMFAVPSGYKIVSGNPKPPKPRK